MNEAERAFVDAVYDEEVAATDAALGQLIKRVESVVTPDSVLWVVTSDHGEELLRERVAADSALRTRSDPVQIERQTLRRLRALGFLEEK